MAGSTREQMITGAMTLLAANGLQGASFSEVLEATGTPRGSIYHHFPHGKSQLIAAAVDRTGREYSQWMERFVGAGADEIVGGFLQIWRHTLTGSDATAGCPVLAVTVSTNDDDLIEHARDVFRDARTQLTGLLTGSGIREEAAAAFAMLLVAACEGAVVLARAERDLGPYETVAASLLTQAAQLPRI